MPLLAVLALSAFSCAAYGGTSEQVLEGGMVLAITYPDSVLAEKTFPVTVLLQNNGWEDKQNVTMAFHATGPIAPVGNATVRIPVIPQGGSYGSTVEFAVLPNALPGTHYINTEYAQTLAGTQHPQETSVAIPVVVKERSTVGISAALPESIFTDAEFPVTVEITPYDANMYDVTLSIIPPQEIQIRGETRHTFSSIRQGESVSVDSRVTTPDLEISEEYRVPFQIRLEYSDGAGDRVEDSTTVSTTLRPRTFMELTADGGIWLGSFFIAPYVSLGTLIGIPAGAILTLALRRRR